MSGALFLVAAIALSVVGSLALWLRSRPPTSFESGIDDFARQRAALSRDRPSRAGRRGAGGWRPGR
jgi:hypothetical protein